MKRDTQLVGAAGELALVKFREILGDEKLNSSAYKDLESFNGELKHILCMFFDKYYVFLFKLNEILESLNSYKIEYKSLIEFLIHNIILIDAHQV